MSSNAKKTPGFNKLTGKSVGFIGKFGYGARDLARMQQIVANEGGTVVDPLQIAPDLLVHGAGVGGNPPAAVAKIQKKHAAVQVLDASDFKKLVAPTAEELVALFRSGPSDRAFWDQMVERTQHVGLDLSGTDFRKLHLTHVIFYGVGLDDCDFRGATLDDVSFDKVTGLKFDDAKMNGGSFSKAEDCSLKNVTMDRVRWNPAEFKRCDFSGATLKIDCGSYTTATDCSFKKADLSNGDLAQSRFQGNDFTGANLSGARLSKCDFTGANLAGANLSKADLRNANLTNCDLRKANFTGAILSNADLAGAAIDGANFTDANLTGTNIAGLDISKAKNLKPTVARVPGPNLLELAKVAKQSKRLQLSIELALGTDEHVVLSPSWSTYGTHGYANASYSHQTPGHSLGNSVDSPTIEQGMLNLADLFSRGKPQIDTVKVEGKKCPLRGKELRDLAVAAWYEALGLPVPSADDLQKQAEQAESDKANLREIMLAELHGGPAGVKKWNERTDKERAKIGKLRKEDFSKAKLNDAHLRSIDFEGSLFNDATMKKAQLGGCSLKEANFTNADLSGAWLHGTKCSDTVFEKAKLSKCNLRAASFRRTNFRGADLTNADFSFSDIGGADFTDANLAGVVFDRTKFDEKTIFPPKFDLPEGLDWRGAGLRPGTKPVVVANAGSMDFDGFYQLLMTKIEAGRIDNARKMLKADRFQLFADVKDDSVVGVVRSQTSSERVYSCRLGNDGRFACCTQNLLPCGGLRGSLCKHILVLIVGLTKAGQLDPATVDAWVDASKSQAPALDKDLMSETFIRFKGAEAGEIDWRPTETIPEDFYAM